MLRLLVIVLLLTSNCEEKPWATANTAKQPQVWRDSNNQLVMTGKYFASHTLDTWRQQTTTFTMPKDDIRSHQVSQRTYHSKNPYLPVKIKALTENTSDLGGMKTWIEIDMTYDAEFEILREITKNTLQVTGVGEGQNPGSGPLNQISSFKYIKNSGNQVVAKATLISSTGSGAPYANTNVYQFEYDQQSRVKAITWYNCPEIDDLAKLDQTTLSCSNRSVLSYTVFDYDSEGNTEHVYADLEKTVSLARTRYSSDHILMAKTGYGSPESGDTNKILSSYSCSLSKKDTMISCKGYACTEPGTEPCTASNGWLQEEVTGMIVKIKNDADFKLAFSERSRPDLEAQEYRYFAVDLISKTYQAANTIQTATATRHAKDSLRLSMAEHIGGDAFPDGKMELICSKWTKTLGLALKCSASMPDGSELVEAYIY